MFLNMNQLKNIGLYMAVIGLLMAGLVWLGKPGESPVLSQIDQGGAPQVFQPLEREFDFGTISMAQGKVKHTFTFANNTANPISLKKIYSSCMCTTALFRNGSKRYGPFGMPGHGAIPSINEKIEPGQSFDIEVEFDPAAHGPAGIGFIKRIVYLETTQGKQTVTIQATVTP